MNAAQVELLIPNIRLPASASEVWYWENNYMDAAQLIRFDAPLSDARAFAKALLHHDIRPDTRPDLPKRDMPWWRDDFPPGAEGTDEMIGGRFIKIMILPIGDKQARVWLSLS
ncbi:MAG TPA: hypothetical protein VK980_12210 [Sphingomonas sp.]|nr:hypothetical protein [Sphingomonas sp.]